jgi:hypothetical protein
MEYLMVLMAAENSAAPALMFNIPIKVEKLLPYGSVSTLTAPFVLNGEEVITHHYMACRI